MAHRKLVSALNRSLLAASTAALVAGPLALSAGAQSLETVTDTTRTVTDGVRETLPHEVECLLTPDEPNPGTRAEEEACELEAQADATAPAAKPARKAAKAKAMEALKAIDGGEDAPAGGALAGEDEESAPTQNQTGGSKVSTAGEDPERVTPIERQEAARRSSASSGSVRFNADGPIVPGTRSFSDLTLQPFQTPVVSVPPLYDLPQIASNFLTGGELETPLAAEAMTGLATSTPTNMIPSSSGTPTDVPLWLLASATGLVMLVGAGHVLHVNAPASAKPQS